MGADPLGSTGDVTQLLHRWSAGDRQALDPLMAVVYDELRRIAARHLASERPGHLLQRTALVHEAFIKLVDQRRVQWQSRGHFFGLAATLMRRIIVDHARHERRAKRGAGAPRLPLDAARHLSSDAPLEQVDAIALDRALTALAALDPTGARVVELRFYGGLTVEETAEVMAVSPSSVKREWAAAKAWLYRELAGVEPGDATPDAGEEPPGD